MIPRQNTTAWTMLSRLPPDCRLRKYDMVIGIIGKTQGVKIARSPNPKATNRNAARPWSWADGAGVAPGAGGLASTYSAGMVTEAEVAAGSIFRLAAPVHFPGTHCVSLQV